MLIEGLSLPQTESREVPQARIRWDTLREKALWQLRLRDLWTIWFGGYQLLQAQPDVQDQENPRIVLVSVKAPKAKTRHDRLGLGGQCLRYWIRPLLAMIEGENAGLGREPMKHPEKVRISCGLAMGVKVRPHPLLWWTREDTMASRFVHDGDIWSTDLAAEFIWTDYDVPLLVKRKHPEGFEYHPDYEKHRDLVRKLYRSTAWSF